MVGVSTAVYPTTKPLLWSVTVCSGGAPGRNGACGLNMFCSAPRQNNGVFAVRGEMVIEAGDERVVIQAHRRAEAVTGIIQPVADGRVVGHELSAAERLIEVTGVSCVLYRRINSQAQRVKGLEVGSA